MKKPEKLRIWALAAAAFILLAVIVFLFTRIADTRRAYDALAAQTPVPTVSPPNLNFRPSAPLFRVGSVGPEVIQLQRRLSELGYYAGELDGKYYEGTQAAVNAFQLQHGLAADGIAGEITLARLYAPDAQRRQESTPMPSTETSGPVQVLNTPTGAYSTPAP